VFGRLVTPIGRYWVSPIVKESHVRYEKQINIPSSRILS
jgi:hypothetical protein